MLDRILDGIAVLGPLVIAIMSVMVGIKLARDPQGQSHKWWWWGIIALGVLCTGATLWQQERTRISHEAEAKDHHAEQIRNEGNLKYMQGQLDSQNKLLAALTANSDPKQIATLLAGMNVQRSTLKKDTFAICSEIEQWATMKQKKNPPPMVAIPGKPTQKESDDQNVYWQKFNADYYTRFGPRVLAIVQQYGAKGIDVRMLEQSASYGYMPQNIILELRSFANRLDENGNLKP